MDYTVTNHGSIWLIQPLTETAANWFADNLPEDAPMLGNAYAVEPRYAGDIIMGAQNAGLTSNVEITA